MSERQSTAVELLKYPVLVIAIVVGIWVLKALVGVEFGVVTEVSTQGVKFERASKATETALADLEGRVNEAAVRIEALEARGKPTVAEAKKVESEAFTAAQTVSDATAEIARLRDTSAPGEVRGYIWIGNFDRQWAPAKLAQIETGQPITGPPEQVVVGNRYRVLGNMAMRDGLPANDADYFRARASVGVIPRGTTVAVVRPAVAIDRQFAVQYWAEVVRVQGDGGK